MKIRSELYLSFSIMAVLLGIAGYLSYSQISKVALSFDEVQNKATPSIIALGNIKSDFNELAAAILAFNLHAPEAADDPEVKETALEHLQEVKGTKAKLLDSYESYRVLEEDKDAANRIGERINGIIAITDEMTLIGEDIMNEGTTAHNTADPAADHMAGEGVLHLHKLVGEFDEQAMTFREELDEKIEANYVSLQSTEANVLSDIENSINLNVVLTMAALSVVFVVGGLAAYSISRRVTKLKTSANRIATGRLEEKITAVGSDEIAELASNFELMRKSLVDAQNELSLRNEKLEELNIYLAKVNKELKKLDRLKDHFIGVASHELRGPIHPILGYAVMAKDGKVNPQVALDVIYRQALRLKQLASDILDVSRIESETLSYNMQKIKIHELLLNTLIAASGNVNFSQVSIVPKLDEENKNLEIMADKDRIGQVFTNIIGNAVKFTKKGSITAETQLSRDGRMLDITISDTGGGIPEDIMPRLFEKFVTKNISDANKEGTGLGLFISKAIVTAHGGKIEAINNNYGGATFKITLPVSSEQARDSGILAAAVRRERNEKPGS